MSKLRRVPVVYLAGGMRSGWQDKVMAALPGVLFIDPRKNGCDHEDAYTAYDLTGVERCDIVFGFIEKDNPGGQGLGVEFGAGVVMGRHLIYVEEEGNPSSRYFGMVRAISDSIYTSFEDGLRELARKCGFLANLGADGKFQLRGNAPMLLEG